MKNKYKDEELLDGPVSSLSPLKDVKKLSLSLYYIIPI
jgi:hypothetical protein